MIAPAAAPTRQPIIKEVITELLETVSATRLNCWQQCRLKFWFHYVLRLKRQSKSSLHIGSMVHSVLQAWNLARWRHKPADLETLQHVFEQTWQESQAGQAINWKDEEEKHRSKTWALLETYFKETPVPVNEKLEGVEVTVEADLFIQGLPTIVGVMDLVRVGGLIVDYKTSGQTPIREKVGHLLETQTSCYSLMYREATGRKESGVEIHHLVKLKKPKVVVTPFEPMTDKQQSRLFKVIESYVSGLERQDFIPSPGLHCSSCEFFDACRNWH